MKTFEQMQGPASCTIYSIQGYVFLLSLLRWHMFELLNEQIGSIAHVEYHDVPGIAWLRRLFHQESSNGAQAWSGNHATWWASKW